MNVFTIKDLENLSGIKAHTIRIWEQRYSFLTPQRTATNIRSYSNVELKTVLNIALLNKYGYKISHIDKMTPVEMNDRILSLSNAEAHQERLINDLIHCMVEIKIGVFEKKLDAFIKDKGVEKTILQIIFPFLQRIGILWLTNHINPAQEHLVSNVIRQKLILGIENIPTDSMKGHACLLFLPEGEYHELGLLFMHYVFKSRGINVFYLGANIPVKDVEAVISITNPDFLYTHLTSVARSFSFEKFLDTIHTRIPGKPMIISGIVTHSYQKNVPAGISLKRSLTEVLDYIAALG